ncbi:hypothetical protein [Mesorhizobium sp. B2-1-5]|uniref:hypothetical protein n=1 Tax=Mesorhizobium sp. B2-1-5 TaxID=2589969 RepID=UPI00112BCA5A|nr:hypothetical protein [Mesorhizobium sp. B2-1-5]TPM94222.1 hypothetical protein FJ966_18310 [Mesorhizobium sp. B2-1-5]
MLIGRAEKVGEAALEYAMFYRPVRCSVAALLLVVSACSTLVAPYDVVFDQSLNKFSEDTATFTAAAISGRPQRLSSSKEAVEYYASAYNLLDRLAQRAQLTRASISCPTNEQLVSFSRLPSSMSVLPEDYRSFDCREFQLYSVRYYLDQLNYGHRNDGVLKPGEARSYGGQLQVATLGAIATFAVTK